MDPGLRINPFIHEHEDPDDQGSHENGTPHSPSSGDETKLTRTTAPSPKKSRRSTEKRVVTVPIADVEGSKSKGDAYPPSDSWAWRKYGQKPIKGSPYPRGYYRCSSSKGCPARKQVERSRVDPTMLIITYAFDHNHPLPATKNHHAATSTFGSPPAASFTVRSPDELGVFATQPELDLCRVDSSLLSSNPDEFGWFAHVVPSDPLFDSPICAGSSCHDTEVATVFSMREEDVSLFADLGDLPDCSVVFRRCSMSTVPCCGSTG